MSLVLAVLLLAGAALPLLQGGARWALHALAGWVWRLLLRKAQADLGKLAPTLLDAALAATTANETTYTVAPDAALLGASAGDRDRWDWQAAWGWACLALAALRRLRA